MACSLVKGCSEYEVGLIEKINRKHTENFSQSPYGHRANDWIHTVSRYER